MVKPQQLVLPSEAKTPRSNARLAYFRLGLQWLPVTHESRPQKCYARSPRAFSDAQQLSSLSRQRAAWRSEVRDPLNEGIALFFRRPIGRARLGQHSEGRLDRRPPPSLLAGQNKRPRQHTAFDEKTDVFPSKLETICERRERNAVRRVLAHF